jgi:hypothetical protein
MAMYSGGRSVTQAERKQLRLEGHKAHKDGKLSDSCPYIPTWGDKADAWLFGYWRRRYMLDEECGLYNPARVAELDQECEGQLEKESVVA